MMWIGPRVTMTMGEDLPRALLAGAAQRRGIPVRATLVQFAIVNLLILITTFQKVVNYVQFSLTLCSALTVLGVFVLRWRRPDLPRPYRTWGYPVTPAIFLAVSGWMLWHLLEDRLHARAIALGTGDRRARTHPLLPLARKEARRVAHSSAGSAASMAVRGGKSATVGYRRQHLRRVRYPDEEKLRLFSEQKMQKAGIGKPITELSPNECVLHASGKPLHGMGPALRRAASAPDAAVSPANMKSKPISVVRGRFFTFYGWGVLPVTAVLALLALSVNVKLHCGRSEQIQQWRQGSLPRSP